jgi:hypothetical protein
MQTLLDEAIAEIKRLPGPRQDAIVRDLLEMLASDKRWDNLLLDTRSKPALRKLAAEARDDASHGDICDFDPATRPQP